jgi:hypothetical protein
VIAYSFWHSAAAGVAESEYDAALGAFMRQLLATGVPGLTRCRSIRFEGLPWVPGLPAYQDWYELEGSSALDSLEAAAVTSAMAAPHSAIARLAGHGSGGLFRSRSDLPAAAHFPEGSETWVTWLDKPAGVQYHPFREWLTEAVAPRASIWQRRLAMGPGKEFCVWLPPDGRSDAAPDVGLPSGAIVVRGRVMASSD